MCCCERIKTSFEKIKNGMSRHPLRFTLFVIMVIIIGTFLIRNFFADWLNPPQGCSLENASEEVDAFLYFFTGVATTALALIAYMQLVPIKRDIEGSFLLEIIKLWEMPQQNEARLLIDNILSKGKKNISDSEKVIKRFKELEEKKTKEKKEYHMITDFLNLLEMMGYFYKKEYISLEQFDELMGTTIIEYGDIFDDCFIKKIKPKQPTALKYFKDLATDVKNRREMIKND